jgi:hypothetical protein
VIRPWDADFRACTQIFRKKAPESGDSPVLDSRISNHEPVPDGTRAMRVVYTV